MARLRSPKLKQIRMMLWMLVTTRSNRWHLQLAGLRSADSLTQREPHWLTPFHGVLAQPACSCLYGGTDLSGSAAVLFLSHVALDLSICPWSRQPHDALADMPMIGASFAVQVLRDSFGKRA